MWSLSPEFIQSALSENIEGRKLGKVKGVKKLTDTGSTKKLPHDLGLPMAGTPLRSSKM
jgi:hypothetical protein